MKDIFIKIGKGILGLVCAPFIIIFILIAFIIYIVVMPVLFICNFFKYRNSLYYKNLRIPYNKTIYYSNGYKFYNAAIKEGLDIKYVKQKNKSLDYFIYKEIIYIFPDFTKLGYNEDNNDCYVVYKFYHKVESTNSLDEFFEKKKSLFEEEVNLPIKLLLSKEYIEVYTDISKLPDSIVVIENYNSTF